MPPTSRFPTQTFWGVLRNDLVHSPVVVAITVDPRVAEKEHTRVMHWWRRGHRDQPELKPELVSAELTWVVEERE
jgi:hypothetical protein